MASATVVTLPQMVDLALNSPEVGIVNFTVLHTLLHVIVKQLDLVDTNVEFRGSDSERLQSYIANAKPGPLLTLTEYTVGEDGTEKEKKSGKNKPLRGVVEKGKEDEQQTEKSEEQNNAVILVESSEERGTGHTVVVTKNHFDRLEHDVHKLEKKVRELAELPENTALIDAMRNQDKEVTPVLDMFQILNLTKRLDAAEVGMKKLASLMEDLAKCGSQDAPFDPAKFAEKAKELKASFGGDIDAPFSPALPALEKRVLKLEKAVYADTPQGGSSGGKTGRPQGQAKQGNGPASEEKQEQYQRDAYEDKVREPEQPGKALNETDKEQRPKEGKYVETPEPQSVEKSKDKSSIKGQDVTDISDEKEKSTPAKKQSPTATTESDKNGQPDTPAATEKGSPTRRPSDKPSDIDKAVVEGKPSPTGKSSVDARRPQRTPSGKQSTTQQQKPSGGKPTTTSKGNIASKVSLKQTPQGKSGPQPTPRGESSEEQDVALVAQSQSVSVTVHTLQQDMWELKTNFQAVVYDVEDIKRLLSNSGDTENLPPEIRLNQLEIKFQDCQEQISSLDHMFCRQVEILQKRIVDLEKDTGELTEKVNLGMAGADANQGEGQTVGELYNKLLQLQEEVSVINENAEKLLEDREEKQHSLEVLQEQIELLKTMKADREDLEDALADKADACLVNRKVSMEQFDAACGDMTKAIEESLAKLTQQEDIWTQCLEEIQKEIGNKLDKMELTPLRDYINKKLKGLQDRFKSLTTLKKDNEAAGTKSKILRNVNCISCDKEVVMKKEIDATLFPKAHGLAPSRNMAPYLAYELDQLRKQQKQIPPKKDLNMFENAIKFSKAPKSPDHLCNRYCGGSHTVTTPQQRVTRLGHFLEQWGPEITTANDTMIRGNDGHMYRGRDDNVFPAVDSKAGPVEETRASKAAIQMATPSISSAQGKGEEEPSPLKKKPSIKLQKTESELKVASPISPEQPPEGEPAETGGGARASTSSENRRKGSTKGKLKMKGKRASGVSATRFEVRIDDVKQEIVQEIVEETVADLETMDQQAEDAQA